jgi:hypothetical protein
VVGQSCQSGNARSDWRSLPQHAGKPGIECSRRIWLHHPFVQRYFFLCISFVQIARRIANARKPCRRFVQWDQRNSTIVVDPCYQATSVGCPEFVGGSAAKHETFSFYFRRETWIACRCEPVYLWNEWLLFEPSPHLFNSATFPTLSLAWTFH